MKERLLKYGKLVFCDASLLSIISAILLIITFNSSYENDIQHFSRYNTLSKVAFYLLILVFVEAAIFAIYAKIKVSKSERLLNAPKPNLQRKIIDILLIIAFLFEFIATLTFAKPNASYEIVGVLITLSAALSAIYYLSRILIPTQSAFQVMAIFPLLWAIFKMLNAYFDSSFAMNSPIKSLRIITYASILLFIILDSRFTFEKQYISSYILLSTCSSITITFSIIWTVISFNNKITTNMYISDTLLLVIYTILAVFSISKYKLQVQEETKEETSDNHED